MEQHDSLMLLDALLMLGFALLAVLAFRRIGLGATLGYLMAGALLGPFVLGWVAGAEEMATVAELGIVMLLFVVGLELSPERLWRMKHLIFGLGFAQVAACGLAVTATILALTGYTLAAALAIGLPLGLSSTAQVLPMLQSAGRLRTPFGEKAFAILLFQDLSIIPLITIVSAMSRNPQADEGPGGWQLALITIGAIVGLILAGRLLIRPLFRLIGGMGERELFIVAALFTVLASATLMQWLGLSAALGAFIAGVMLADTPYRHELEADIEPFRAILLGLFFVAVGMMLDLGAIAERPLFVFGFAALLIVIKTAIITGIGMIMKMRWKAAVGLGLLLSQGGEFAFVLYTAAQNALLIEQESASIFGAIVTLSMAATPFLMMATRRIRQEVADEAETREEPQPQGASAVVVGYGRFGQSVAQVLMAGGLSVTVIDRNAAQIDVAEEFGSKVYYGDGTRMDMLRQAGAGDAQLIMFCMDEVPDAELVAAVADAWPNAAIYVRGFDRKSVIDLAKSPAQYVIREVFESAIRMADIALEHVGLSQEERDSASLHYRENDRERMRLQIEGGDIYAAKDMTREQQRVLRLDGPSVR
ncbi:sodium:proton exchanger [Erythrobacter arachoides]|uniref:Sodium:proton exchanger n=1 Tax=Aurantiacibacter arachoides TaxID=1850444 RepID=A0A844ZYF4_9SPHN|nr:cation:proton antiporter [Aurantiacibacter arachoides]MXO92250.1 sodium:proton exchanger [Aurantiacibacter arachoides]GGD58539.1 potassium efflux system protein [Aurantiacibacter arachoides]